MGQIRHRRVTATPAPHTGTDRSPTTGEPPVTDPSLPPSRRGDARIARTDRALRAALLSLLDTRSFEQITIREIVAVAGIHYATFFRHHPTKEALLDHVAADQIDQIVALALPVQTSLDYPAAFTALCAYVATHRKVWAALLAGGAAGAMRAELLRVSSQIAADRGASENWLPVELGVACSVSLIVETITWWLQQGPDACPVAEVAAILHRLVAPLIQRDGTPLT